MSDNNRLFTVLIETVDGYHLFGDQALIQQICEACSAYPNCPEWKDTPCTWKYARYCDVPSSKVLTGYACVMCGKPMTRYAQDHWYWYYKCDCGHEQLVPKREEERGYHHRGKE